MNKPQAHNIDRLLKILKTILITAYVAIIAVMASATVIGKISAHTATSIYGSLWFVAIWTILAIAGMAYIFRQRLYRRPFNFIFHIALACTLAGALVTHIFGEQGTIYATIGEKTSIYLTKNEMQPKKLPFEIELKEFYIENYEGTQSPMDYVSCLKFGSGSDTTILNVSMNKIIKYCGYRFYQSGYDPDLGGTYLSVSHDPIGIGITYVGYALLFISMLLFLISPNESFRLMLKKISQYKFAIFVLGLIASTLQTEAQPQKDFPPIVQPEIAQCFGELYVYSNGRICPMQTLARNFTIKLYGKDTYKHLSAEQVFFGWIMTPEQWANEPMIKLKGSVKDIVGNGSKFVSYNEFFEHSDYKLYNAVEQIFCGKEIQGAKSIREADEKINIIKMLLDGQFINMFPHKQNGQTVWYCQNDKLPSEMPENEQTFHKKCIDNIREQYTANNTAGVLSAIDNIKKHQQEIVKDELPSTFKLHTEHIYNKLTYTKMLSMSLTSIGIVIFVISTLLLAKRRRLPQFITITLNIILAMALAYMFFSIAIRGIIGGHIPLSNGYETMQFMSVCALALTICFQRRFPLIIPFGFIISGLTIMVSMFSETNPQITHLMPVLTSPLMSIHVCILMIAYTLLAFLMLNGITAIVLSRKPSNNEQVEWLFNISKFILYPALFLLTAGIFIGAIWANQSWGRYWGWDPKEVWALITMMIYAMPMHHSMFTRLQKPLNAHIFFALAFISVLITYFGVNFLLGGMHSYA